MVFPTFFNLSLDWPIWSSWSEPQSAPGLVYSEFQKHWVVSSHYLEKRAVSFETQRIPSRCNEASLFTQNLYTFPHCQDLGYLVPVLETYSKFYHCFLFLKFPSLSCLLTKMYSIFSDLLNINFSKKVSLALTDLIKCSCNSYVTFFENYIYFIRNSLVSLYLYNKIASSYGIESRLDCLLARKHSINSLWMIKLLPLVFSSDGKLLFIITLNLFLSILFILSFRLF